MAVGYRSSSTSSASDDYTTSVSVPVPAGAQANDIAVVAIEQWEVGNPTVTPPTGFTALTPFVVGSTKLKVFWKRLTGADAGSYTFTWTGQQWNVGQCILLTGVKTSGDPIGVHVDTDSATGILGPTTETNTAFVPGQVHFTATENGTTHTPPSGFTEVQDANVLATNYRLPAGSGLNQAPTPGAGTSTLILVFLLALEPATGGGGAVALDGTGSAASSATGALSRARALSSTASGAASATGALSRSRPVSGTASAASSASGNLSVTRTVAGSASASATADGDLSLAGIVNLDGAATAAADAAGTVAVGRGLTGSASAASSASGELSMVTPVWRLVMPTIQEKWTLRGSLTASAYREATVFGDENGLYTTERGSRSVGSDEYGGIPFGTKYIWYGGHVNVTDDPAIKNLWLSHGFSVETFVT